MQSFVDLEIRQRLTSYVSRDISLRQFQEWFIPLAWEVENTGNVAAIELADEIQLRLAEHSSGHWTEEELRARLLPLVERYVAHYRIETASLSYSSSSDVIRSPVTYPGSIVGIRVVKASA